MRLIIDAILIVILLVVGSALQDYSQNIRGEAPIQERIDQFETDIANNKVIQDTYTNSKPYLRQIEENSAGKLAEKASKFVIEFVDVTMDFTSEILKLTWK